MNSVRHFRSHCLKCPNSTAASKASWLMRVKGLPVVPHALLFFCHRLLQSVLSLPRGRRQGAACSSTFILLLCKVWGLCKVPRGCRPRAASRAGLRPTLCAIGTYAGRSLQVFHLDFLFIVEKRKSCLQWAKQASETGRSPAHGAAGTFVSECHGYYLYLLYKFENLTVWKSNKLSFAHMTFLFK